MRRATEPESPTPVLQPPLTISAEQVCFVILKAREVETRDSFLEPDPESSPSRPCDGLAAPLYKKVHRLSAPRVSARWQITRAATILSLLSYILQIANKVALASTVSRSGGKSAPCTPRRLSLASLLRRLLRAAPKTLHTVGHSLLVVLCLQFPI
jgi:hypothetical protein